MIDKEIVRQLVENFAEGTEIFPVTVEVKPGNIVVVEIGRAHV